MMSATRVLYDSPNGDRWSLIRDAASGRISVLHEPNPASGGRVAHLDLGEFLRRDGQGPEHQELLRLVGTLVEAPAD